jgi:ferredoxin
MGRRKFSYWLRWAFRLFFLAAAVFLVLGGPLPAFIAARFPGLGRRLPEWTLRIIPGLSPLGVASGSLTIRGWYTALFWALPPLFFLVMAVWKGRFFCRWVCPTGTLHALPAQVSRRKRLLRTRINGVLFWAVMGGGALGLPFFIFLDPLSSFNRLSPIAQEAYTAAAVIPGIILPAFMLLSFFQPLIWCTHICPLGYFFDLVYVRSARPAYRDAATRRQLAVGLLVGVPLALLARRLSFPVSLRASAVPPPILPPGAADAATFAGACSRCYACVNVCPTQVIRVPMPGARTLGRFFHPELDHEKSYCEEYCNKCSQVCPAGAIRPLSMEQKRHRQIGVAQVRREACLAWADGEYCMVCQEFCPYHAIETDLDVANDIPRPVVRPEICRGCGFCQNQCPAVRLGTAIIVHGVEEQGTAEDAF